MLWEELEVSAEVKGRKLQEASEGQQFYRSVKDVDLWVDEVEKQLSSEDLGKVGGASSIVGGATIIIYFEVNVYYIPLPTKWRLTNTTGLGAFGPNFRNQ